MDRPPGAAPPASAGLGDVPLKGPAMMQRGQRRGGAWLAAALWLGLVAAALAADRAASAPVAGLNAAATADALRTVRPQVVAASPGATQALMLGLARAGARAVAVGERGMVLEIEGGTPRQVTGIPLDATLTSVHFVDAEKGWAVGHWGAILHTADGGRRWAAQRTDLSQDRPLFAVHFLDARHGVAVGLWSLVLATADGGQTWETITMPTPPGARKADLNLLGLFADGAGRLWATGERGLVAVSDDRGRNWRYLTTGAKGSLWCGIALADGGVLVAGQRGALWRSDDGGQTWRSLDSGGRSSITAIASVGSQVVAVGLDGYYAVSSDGGRSFAAQPRTDRLSLTAVVPDGARGWWLGSRAGVVAQAGAPAAAAASAPRKP